MAAVNIYVGVYYFFLYIKRQQIKEHFPFSMLCVCAGLYDVFCAGLYNSISLEQGIIWQRLQLNIIGFVSVFFVWFINGFTEQKSKLIIKLSTIWFLIILIASFLVNPGLSLSLLKPAIKHVSFFSIFNITYYECEMGIVYIVETLSILVLYLYLLVISIRYYLKSRSRIFLVFICSLAVFFFGVANDILVGLQVYSFIYVSEYAYFSIIMAMAYILLSKFVGVQIAYEELNNKLELKVEERTEENEKLQDKLHQSEKMAAVGQLAGGVAHEINNPMTIILGYAQIVLKRIKPEDPLSKPLLAIEKEAIRCKKLIENLLTFSRASKMVKQTGDVNKAIKEAVALIEPQAKVKNTGIVVNYADKLPDIMIDVNQIQQIIINLCNNAMDAMPAGGTIKIETAQDEKFIKIAVSDNGSGISDENKKKLFEPFFTTKEVGKGTGLGLSICYELANKHGGDISVESEVGKGTTFTVRLPK